MKYNKNSRRKATRETYNNDYSSQESEEYIAKGKKRARQRQENSLGELTKSFINYVKESGTDTININELVKKLKVKKRRIYDITNVLEGIGYIKKHAKNEISWLRTEMLRDDNHLRSNTNVSNQHTTQQNKSGKNQSIDIKELENQNKQLDASISKIKKQFVDISDKDEFNEYGYVTLDDLKLLTTSEKINLLAIKAPKGTSLEIMNPEETKKAYLKAKSEMENGTITHDGSLLESLKKEHHLFLDAPEGEILVYVALTESERAIQPELNKYSYPFSNNNHEPNQIIHDGDHLQSSSYSSSDNEMK